MKENWENENIRKICEEKNCVALKLEDKSGAAKQFAAICKFYEVSKSNGIQQKDVCFRSFIMRSMLVFYRYKWPYIRNCRRA